MEIIHLNIADFIAYTIRDELGAKFNDDLWDHTVELMADKLMGVPLIDLNFKLCEILNVLH